MGDFMSKMKEATFIDEFTEMLVGAASNLACKLLEHAFHTYNLSTNLLGEAFVALVQCTTVIIILDLIRRALLFLNSCCTYCTSGTAQIYRETPSESLLHYL